jgi:hypothetical protein
MPIGTSTGVPSRRFSMRDPTASSHVINYGQRFGNEELRWILRA